LSVFGEQEISSQEKQGLTNSDFQAQNVRHSTLLHSNTEWATNKQPITVSADEDGDFFVEADYSQIFVSEDLYCC
jgi:hypothetical protein